MVKRLLLTVHGGRRYGKKIASHSTQGHAIWWGGSSSLYMGIGVMVGKLFLTVHGGRRYGKKKVTFHSIWGRQNGGEVTSHSTWMQALW